MAADLINLLAQGKTYLWALRHSQNKGLTTDAVNEIKRDLGKNGLDIFAISALRQLEYPIARSPYPMFNKAVFDDFYFFPIPAFNIEIFFKTMICEHGLEMGMELFPSKVDWTFGHDEIQYCIGGDTRFDMIFPDTTKRTVNIRAGDVTAFPGGTRYIAHSAEEGRKFGHSHVFLTNVGEQEGQIFYDVGSLLKLQSLKLIDPPPGQEALPFSDVSDRIEIKNFSDLLTVSPDRERDLPTWLRNGWSRREEARTLDYAEGTRTTVVSSPDRKPNEFIEWGEGEAKCYVNPLIAEATAAISDCRFPKGYKRLHWHKELWTVLKGQAKIRQSVPPLHGEWKELELSENCVMVAAGGAHFHVLEATEDFVVRRLAETCAHNCHALMMERKLEIDGVSKNI
jgi:hypothetical protein